MRIDVSAISFAIRSQTAASPHPIKLSHAQQCVAAALGYNSLASLQASDADIVLDRDSHVVLDPVLLAARAGTLGVSLRESELVALVIEGLRHRLPGIDIHTSLDECTEAIRNAVNNLALNDEQVAGELTTVNGDGLGEIYLPFDIPWDQVPTDGTPLEIDIQGHVSMNIDDERPYWGHKVEVHATLEVSQPAKAVRTASLRINNARLKRPGDDEDRDEPALISLEQALVEELDVSWADADLLVDAPMHDNASKDGLIYSYIFDFSRLDLPARLRRKIEKKTGSLQLEVMPWFRERLHGAQPARKRHYVHGDQHETETSKFFCLSCDAFFEASHFAQTHPADKGTAYAESLRRWTRWPARSKLNVWRPANPHNAFAAAASTGNNVAENANSLYLKMNAIEDDARNRHFNEAGGRFLYSLTEDSASRPVLEFLIGNVDLPMKEASTALHADIEHGYRMSRDPGATIVLNIQTATIPEFVFDAIEQFHYFGIGLVVVHGDNCSLDEKAELPLRLMSFIRDAGGQRQVWHPRLQELVWM